MILTPKPVREAIAKATGRSPTGIMVRVWAAALVYFLAGAIVGYMVAKHLV